MPKVNQSVLNSFLSIRTNILRYVSRLVPPADVEDIVQDAYIRLCSLEDKNPEKYNNSYFYTVAKNLAFDHIKRAEFKLADSIEDESEYHIDDSDSTYDCAAAHERFGVFCDVVKNMPKQCRRVFVLRKVYGFSQQEIAEKLDISINTVSNHLVNGMKIFRRLKINEPLVTNTNLKSNAKNGS